MGWILFALFLIIGGIIDSDDLPVLAKSILGGIGIVGFLFLAYITYAKKSDD